MTAVIDGLQLRSRYYADLDVLDLIGHLFAVLTSRT
jgi:hypothetical protein